MRGPRQRCRKIDRPCRDQSRDPFARRCKLHDRGRQYSSGQEPANGTVVVARDSPVDRTSGPAISVDVGVFSVADVLVMAVPGVGAARRVIMPRGVRMPQTGHRAGQQPSSD